MSAKKRGRPRKAPRDQQSDMRTPLPHGPTPLKDWQEMRASLGEFGTRLPKTPPKPKITESEEARLRSVAHKYFLQLLKHDPLNEDPLTAVFAGVISGEVSDADEKLVGSLWVKVMKTGDPERIKDLACKIARLAENAKHPRRAFHAYQAYVDFIEATEREPSKRELKKFILARSNQSEDFKRGRDRKVRYMDMPAEEDKKAWTRIWHDSGLFGIRER